LNTYNKTLKIGSLEVQPGLTLAPMAGITSQPFRLIAREQGCRLLFSEMISAKGLLYGNYRSDALLYFTEDERPIGLQIFGSDPKIMAAAAECIEKYNPDFIDLNLGCPTRKITKNGEGGALLRNPALCSEIFKAVRDAVSCPVTAKLRKGWDELSINVLEIAARAEEAGINALTIHGRTVEQGYSGKADWDIIRQVKEHVGIPVIGNGDIDSARAAIDMLKLCQCDGIMIGRAARGNPWLFAEVLAALENRPLPEPPTVDQIVKMALQHFKLLLNLKGEAAAAREMRRHSSWYIKGLPGAAAIRQKLIRVKSYAETEAILTAFVTQGGPF
jgi:tRNA-dihydrouridine synthase B